MLRDTVGLRGEAHAKGAGVKAGTQRSWGARSAGLDAGASAAYLASPSSRKNSSGQRQARGAASELRPPARPPRPWDAFHGVPVRGHTARRVKDRSTYPGSAATHEGRGGTLPPHGAPAHARAASARAEVRLTRPLARAGVQTTVAVLLVRAARPSLDAGALRQYIAKPGKERESPQRDSGRRGKRSAEPPEGVWGREASAAWAERSGAGASRCALRGAMR